MERLGQRLLKTKIKQMKRIPIPKEEENCIRRKMQLWLGNKPQLGICIFKIMETRNVLSTINDKAILGGMREARKIQETENNLPNRYIISR